MIGSKLEAINFIGTLPYRCIFYEPYATRRHYHNEISIFLLIKGQAEVIVEDNHYVLNEDDVILINPLESHELISGLESYGILLQFDPKKFYISKNIHFKHLINDTTDLDLLYQLKSIIYTVFKNCIENKYFNNIRTIHDLIAILFENCRELESFERKVNKHQARIDEIAEYIEKNYSKRITLQELASKQALSISYLSNFFEKNFGKTFLQYYNDIRIDHAIDDLLNSNFSIDEISLRNGFDDPRSFVSAFKKRYHILPSIYRKKSTSRLMKDKLKNENEIDVDKLSYIKEKFNTFLIDKPTLSSEFISPAPEKLIEINSLDITKQGTPFNKNFNHAIGVVSAHDMLLGDVQSMLIRAKKDINFKYVKFHGILSDEMEVYNESPDGEPILNFFLIDKVLDFILSISMKPIIELTYMPSLLALHPKRYLYNNKCIASEPKDLNKWQHFIEGLLEHIISKYGENEINTWYFTIWNLPESGTSFLGFDSDQRFFEFYLKTYNCIKGYLPDSVMLSPTIGLSPGNPSEFFSNFVEFCSSNDCMPDIINVTYSNEIFQMIGDMNTIQTTAFFKKNPDALLEATNNTISFFKEKNINAPIFLSTWMLTSSHRNLINDTVFKSCYYVKNYLQVHDKIDLFGLWCLTDLNGESPLNPSLFYGGQGMLTKRGIEKSTYNALILLSKLGKEIIYQDEGILVTRSYKKIQILLYNYQHYSDLYAEGKITLEANNRYIPFDLSKKHRYKIVLNNITSDKVFIKTYTVSQQHGSSYDAFLRMGGVELKYDDEFDHLQRHSSYYIEVEEQKTVNNTITINKIVPVLGIYLIEIKL